MTRMPHPVLTWAANILVPGTGLVLLGRLALGTLLALWWCLAMVGLILATIVWPDSCTTTTVVSFAASASAAYVLAQLLHGVRRRVAGRHLTGEGRDKVFKAALVATLQGRLDDAEAACKALLRQDGDDVEATLHLGTLARHRGDREAALRYLRRAQYLDDEGRWDFEIGREMAAVVSGSNAVTTPHTK